MINRPFICVAEGCDSCDSDHSTDEYTIGYREGYRAARELTAREREAITKREAVANATERRTRIAMAEAEERHLRTLQVMDAEVARLTAALAVYSGNAKGWVYGA